MKRLLIVLAMGVVVLTMVQVVSVVVATTKIPI